VDRPRDNKCRATKAPAKGSASSAFVKSLRMPHFVPCTDAHADRISGRTPICRPGHGPHGGFSAAHESPETEPAAVELSGFPTARKSSSQRWLPFQTERCVLLPDWRAGRFPLPRDDIPSSCMGARPDSVPPPPGPDRNFVSPFVFTQRCSMGRPEKILSWWDREVDLVGRPIRDDVRSAAHEVWAEAGRRTEALVADRAQAADLMEDSVARVSRYLDRIEAPKSSPKNGLLLLAFSRALRRLAAKSRRLQLAGGAVELSSLAVDHGWIRQVNAQLELQNLVRKLSERNGTILALRCAGYNWEEVAQKFGTSVTRIRNGFWREVRDVRRKLQADEKQRHPIDHNLSQALRTSHPEEA
jgi:DNA-directed RNA polymerase specialized sigma24 family protein